MLLKQKDELSMPDALNGCQPVMWNIVTKRIGFASMWVVWQIRSLQAFIRLERLGGKTSTSGNPARTSWSQHSVVAGYDNGFVELEFHGVLLSGVMPRLNLIVSV